ncbi:MAG TPA: type IV toxin-antitoxin system AbiEi family antitoxin domain-containing protein [Solirubrobacterales bacterium]|nr:type IV toxin-antitoxin system AbiEi family antitoxin domain-containing protein [Solirubrobacterales bacterium]
MTRERNTAAGNHLATLAGNQHGVVARAQLRALGLGEDAIDHAARTGRLHRVFRGVYAVGYPTINERGRLMAAALACGKGAAISHRSAGALLGLLDKGPVVIDVIAPPSRGRKIDGIRFHRVRPPRLDEVGTVAGIPCTSPARTLVDLAGTVGDWTLRSCFERAAQKKSLDIAAIEASMDPGRRGNRSLRALIAEWRKAAPVAKKGHLKSPLEAKVLPLVLARDHPAPLLNAPVEIAKGRIEVDFLWPNHRFALQADSRDFHATHIAFERDRWRDRELLRVGYATLRVTHRQAETEAGAIADTIASRLSKGA